MYLKRMLLQGQIADASETDPRWSWTPHKVAPQCSVIHLLPIFFTNSNSSRSLAPSCWKRCSCTRTKVVALVKYNFWHSQSALFPHAPALVPIYSPASLQLPLAACRLPLTTCRLLRERMLSRFTYLFRHWQPLESSCGRQRRPHSLQ